MSAATAASHPLPPGRRALTTVVVMAATVMVILDTTIANVALPHMQSALGATQDSVSWVLTSYILASAVSTPVTGWLSDRYGRRLLFTAAVAGFTIASALCGVSTSLEMMVAARILQGVFGAFLVPLSQAVMFDINPPEKHASAMTVWGIGVMVGPVMGPVLGGWLTDQLDWRWVFFVNVPIGIVTTIGCWALIPGRPGERRRFDILGFVLLGLALSAFQLLLDRGTQEDWFQSVEIWIEAGVAVSALWMFIVHSFTHRAPLVPMALFRDRNFAAALLLITVMGGILTAGATLIAPMLQRLMDYPVFDAGLMVAPRGIGTMVGMILAGRLAGRVDPRWTILVGLLLVGWSLHIQTGFNLEMDSRLIIESGLIQGAGIGLVVMPLNLLAFATLAPVLRTEAAALYSLMRNLGGSIAISVTTALIASNVQTSHADLGATVTTMTLPFLNSGIIEGYGQSTEALLAFLDLEVNRQALMIAYLDDFWLMMWACLALIPLLLLLRAPRRGASAPPAAAME